MTAFSFRPWTAEAPPTQFPYASPKDDAGRAVEIQLEDGTRRVGSLVPQGSLPGNDQEIPVFEVETEGGES